MKKKSGPTIKTPKFRRISPQERRSRLIDAGLACLAKGGIRAFTMDNICREAKISRGLVAHHFGSKDALLAEVYAAVYDRMLAHLVPPDAASTDIVALVENSFSPSLLNGESLNIWLALWSEIASNPALRTEHRKHYALYREGIARLISATARDRGRTVDSYELATIFISLVDGLWLEQCIDSSVLSATRAKDVCYSVLETALGPLRRPASRSVAVTA
ncbi:MAG: TetR family transcriptional regulator C-terminal domain-containing protein [Proteobacteria bacterium]|nr:TetR family transcriptional regulator C-terminal domain-containing protein [Pseudomonadota bacterium]